MAARVQGPGHGSRDCEARRGRRSGAWHVRLAAPEGPEGHGGRLHRVWRLSALICVLVRMAAAGGDSDVEFERGMALARQGQLEEAARIFDAARRQFPEDPRFPTELAGVAYREHRAGEAKDLLREALRLNPSDKYGNDFLATLYWNEGNLPAALRYWNRIQQPVIGAVNYDPGPPLGALLRDRVFVISAGQVLTRDRLETTQANLLRLGLHGNRFELVPAAEKRYELT